MISSTELCNRKLTCYCNGFCELSPCSVVTARSQVRTEETLLGNRTRRCNIFHMPMTSSICQLLGWERVMINMCLAIRGDSKFLTIPHCFTTGWTVIMSFISLVVCVCVYWLASRASRCLLSMPAIGYQNPCPWLVVKHARVYLSTSRVQLNREPMWPTDHPL